MRAVRRVVVATLLVGVAACSDAGDEATESDTALPRTTTGAGASCLDRSSTVRRHTRAESEDVFLTGAVVSRIDDCVDEVTFEFRSAGTPLPPGYSVEYDEGPFRDYTSGDEFEPAGEAYLVLRFAKTAVFAPPVFPGAPPEPTYTGRESIDPSGMNHLQEARIVQGPPGVIQWVIGLDSTRPFSIDGSSLALPPESSSTTTTTTSPSGASPSTSSTSTTTPPPATAPAATARIVVRIG
jgi:hypothetical protein